MARIKPTDHWGWIYGLFSAPHQQSRKIPSFRVPGPWGEEAICFLGPVYTDPLIKGKISDLPSEYQPLARLLRSKKPLPNPLPLELLPSKWRDGFVARAHKSTSEEKDLAITDFIESRMPADRKRKGVPKNLIADAKKKFGLKSKSAVLRAYARGRKRNLLQYANWADDPILDDDPIIWEELERRRRRAAASEEEDWKKLERNSKR